MLLHALYLRLFFLPFFIFIYLFIYFPCQPHFSPVVSVSSFLYFSFTGFRFHFLFSLCNQYLSLFSLFHRSFFNFLLWNLQRSSLIYTLIGTKDRQRASKLSSEVCISVHIQQIFANLHQFHFISLSLTIFKLSPKYFTILII